MSAEPSSSGKRNKKGEPKVPNKLVLCFDGTGNKFSGTSSDTNIVKFYQMCDRTAKGQFHYYQRCYPPPPPALTIPSRPWLTARGKQRASGRTLPARTP